MNTFRGLTYRESLQEMESLMKPRLGGIARLEAEKLICQALELSWSELMLSADKTLTEAQGQGLAAPLLRRLEGEPLAYIFNKAYFFGESFFVDHRVLIPRPETEILVEEALKVIPEGKACRVVDLGCGSGCIGLSIARRRPQAQVLMVDKSPGAVEVARRNWEQQGGGANVEILKMPVEAQTELQCRGQSKYDVVVANPPYIEKGDLRVGSSVREHEPEMALFAGEQGLEWIHKWLKWSYDFMNQGGSGFFEIGVGQVEAVSNLVAKCGLSYLDCYRDYQSIPRIVSYRKV